MPDYITAVEWGLRNNKSENRVRQLISLGRIPGACKIDSRWMVPSDTADPTRKPGRLPICRDEGTVHYIMRMERSLKMALLRIGPKRVRQWLRELVERENG